jgi:hypothetical protein
MYPWSASPSTRDTGFPGNFQGKATYAIDRFDGPIFQVSRTMKLGNFLLQRHPPEKVGHASIQ